MNYERLTAPKQDAEFVQATNAIPKVRSAHHFLHFRFSSVYLFKMQTKGKTVCAKASTTQMQ